MIRFVSAALCLMFYSSAFSADNCSDGARKTCDRSFGSSPSGNRARTAQSPVGKAKQLSYPAQIKAQILARDYQRQSKYGYRNPHDKAKALATKQQLHNLYRKRGVRIPRKWK